MARGPVPLKFPSAIASAIFGYSLGGGILKRPFLKEAKRRRMLDRVMFGSDQMLWPEAIALAIDRVNRLDFLTVADKQDIFYDNAATFLGLSPEEVARHHR